MNRMRYIKTELLKLFFLSLIANELLNCMGRVIIAALISPEGFPPHYLGIGSPEQCTFPLGEERFLCGIAQLVVCSSMSNTQSFTDPLSGSFASLLSPKIILWILFKNKKIHLLLLSHIDFPRQKKGGLKWSLN